MLLAQLVNVVLRLKCGLACLWDPLTVVTDKKLHHFIFAVTLSNLSIFELLSVCIYPNKFGTKWHQNHHHVTYQSFWVLTAFPFTMSCKLQSDVHCGGAIWWMLMEWRPGVVDWGVVCSLAAYRGSNSSLAHAVDGCISTAAPLALAHQLPLLMIVKRGWSDFPVRHAI